MPPRTKTAQSPERAAGARLHLGLVCALALGFVVLVAIALGCHSSPPPDPTPRPVSQSTASRGLEGLPGEKLAIVSLRATSLDGGSRRAVQLHGAAHFARYQGVDRQSVIRLLGETDYADLSELELNRCVIRLSQRSQAVPADDGSIEVELHDAGHVTVELPGLPLELRPQPFPEFAGFISGLSYQAARSQRMWPSRGDTAPIAKIIAAGGFDVAPFGVEVEIPRPLRLVEVGGRVVVDGTASPHPHAPLTLTWDPAGVPATLLLVEFRRSGYDSAATVRCLVEDSGSFTIPGEKLTALPRFSGTQTDRVAVQRLMVQSFQTRDIEDGIAIFAAEDAVLLR